MRQRKRIPRTDDFQQLALLCVDEAQRAYEASRDLFFFEGITPEQRAQQTGLHPSTLRRYIRRLETEGMSGLPQRPRKRPPTPGRHPVPEAIEEEVRRLKALHAGLADREIAHILFVTQRYRIDHKTVRRVLTDHPPTVQPKLDFDYYHDYADPYQARLQVVKLFYRGWRKKSVSEFLHVSPKQVTRILRAFAKEQFAGLVPKSKAPKDPARKITLPLMVSIYHLQKQYPQAGEFRIWSLLGREDVSARTVGRIMATNRLVYDDLPKKEKPKEEKEPQIHPYKPDFAHQRWFMDVRHLPVKIDGQKVYSICVLEGHSRTVLAGMVWLSEATWVILTVLYAACRKYGVPHELLTDSGSAFRAKRFEQVMKDLGIQHRRLRLGGRKAYLNRIEPFFGIQRRMADFQFEQATSLAQVQLIHEQFLEKYNTTKHWGLLQDGLDPGIPLQVLRGLRGFVKSSEELPRAFHTHLFPRVVNPYGCVSLHNYYFYVEDNVPKKQVLLWVYAGKLRAELEGVILCEYRCRFDAKVGRVKGLSEPTLYETRFRKGQLDLIPLHEGEYLQVIQRERKRPERKVSFPDCQLLLFEVIAGA